MSAIDASIVRMGAAALHRSAAPKQDAAAVEDRDTDPGRPVALRKTALLQALELNDDLSGLVSSMRRSRSRDDAGDIRGQAWLDHVLDPDAPGKLSLLKAELKAQLKAYGTADTAALRTLLAQLFPDPSDAVAVLRALLSDAELEDMRAELQQVHEQLLNPDDGTGGAVRAGLNVSLKARLAAPHLGASRLRATARQLRRSYQDFLAGGDPIDTYQLWIDLYGFQRRSVVVDFAEQALAADMYALDPSCSRLEFGHLLQRMRQITTLRSADHLLLACCWKPGVMARIDVDEPGLLSALLGMVRDGGGLPVLFEGVFSRTRHRLDAGEKAQFAQGIRRFLKAVPHSLWADARPQLSALDEVEALLERATEHERRTSPAMLRVVA